MENDLKMTKLLMLCTYNIFLFYTDTNSQFLTPKQIMFDDSISIKLTQSNITLISSTPLIMPITFMELLKTESVICKMKDMYGEKYHSLFMV